ncbi:MAG: nucleotidyltransferase family protein [Ignisphaera sp.]
MKSLKAVILAGGYGKRLRPLTEDRPKSMVEVCGKPLAEWQIIWLKSFGITDFVFLLGYAKEKVIEYFGSGKKFGVKISYVIEDEPLGTGGAIKNAEHILKNEDMFIILNGDIISNLNPMEMVNLIKKDDGIAVIALVYMRSPYGIVKLDGEYITEFVEKPTIEYTINAGVYVMKPKIFEYLPQKGDIERTAFPLLANKRLLKGYIYKDVYWKSVDTIKDLEEVAEKLKSLYPSLCYEKLNT